MIRNILITVMMTRAYCNIFCDYAKILQKISAIIDRKSIWKIIAMT